MKHYTLKAIATLSILIISTFGFSQNQEGVIEFESKMNMHRGISVENEQMKAMIPEFRITKNRLYFTPNTSFYTNVEEETDNQEITGGSGGANITMKIQRPQMDMFRNFDSQTFITQTDFAGKKFRIEDTLKAISWKFIQETKEIAGYKCSKATFRNETNKQDIVAWYTDAIVCPSGPQNHWGLPGMILEIDINEGGTVITAKKVEFKSVEKEVKMPKEGKKVTAKEFKKIQDDYYKEMGITPGQPGQVRMIIRN